MNYRPQPGTDARASNAQMAARILEMPAQPFTEGGFVYRVAEMTGRKSGDVIQVADSEILAKLDLVAVFRFNRQDAPTLTKNDNATNSFSTSER